MSKSLWISEESLKSDNANQACRQYVLKRNCEYWSNQYFVFRPLLIVWTRIEFKISYWFISIHIVDKPDANEEWQILLFGLLIEPRVLHAIVGRIQWFPLHIGSNFEHRHWTSLEALVRTNLRINGQLLIEAGLYCCSLHEQSCSKLRRNCAYWSY